MLTRTVRYQLTAFLVVSCLAMALLGLSYAGVPSLVGIGTYDVKVAMPQAAGLYPRAAVTLRGVDVGQVRGLSLTPDGKTVMADLRLRNGTHVPRDLAVQVDSQSAVGEQYVNLVPRSTGGPMLKAGQTVAASAVTLPVSTDQLLSSVNGLLASVPRDDLRTAVDEAYQAFNGTGPDLQRLLDAGAALTQTATDNLEPTIRLLQDSVPVLATQLQTAPQLAAYSRNLHSFTQQLAASDPQLRSLLTRTGPAVQQVSGLFTDLQPVLPHVLADLATVGNVLTTYDPAINHVLVLVPTLVTKFQGALDPHPQADGATRAELFFKLGVDDPPVCTTGFEDAGKIRDPNDLSPAPLPNDSYCKVPADSPLVVRGVRNDPCPNSSLRGATAALCGLVFPDLAATLLQQGGGTPPARGATPAGGPARDTPAAPTASATGPHPATIGTLAEHSALARTGGGVALAAVALGLLTLALALTTWRRSTHRGGSR